MFKNLEKELISKGYDLNVLAKVIGNKVYLTKRKFYGRLPFTLGEIKTIRDELFPGMPLDYLFEEERI